jgi:hypothetical protein
MICTIAKPSTQEGGRRATQPFAWQGWQLRVPASWNALALEGDYFKGHALLADMDGPRLGVRWRAMKARHVTEETLRRAIRDEAGDDAARRTKPLPNPDTDRDAPWDQLLAIDRDVPGRDVYVKYGASGRLVQLVYHARRRDDVLAGELLPTFAETGFTRSQFWAVFDLSCAVPAALSLKSHRLNAGDHTLHFVDFSRFIIVRQIALAEIALKRTPLRKWLSDQQRARRLRYKVVGEPSEVTVETEDGRALVGLIGRMRRRRRFWWSWGWSREAVTLTLYDEARDRVVIVESHGENVARDVAKTVGCNMSS